MADLAELGIDTIQLDVTNQHSIAACHKAVRGITGGKLDILVNNAFSSPSSLPEDCMLTLLT
jgi:1-acylglycerone phosphate reductase